MRERKILLRELTGNARAEIPQTGNQKRTAAALKTSVKSTTRARTGEEKEEEEEKEEDIKQEEVEKGEEGDEDGRAMEGSAVPCPSAAG
eukprot:453503-Pyramimonas_sp.AAC.1